jgi:hypothetical protein
LQAPDGRVNVDDGVFQCVPLVERQGDAFPRGQQVALVVREILAEIDENHFFPGAHGHLSLGRQWKGVAVVHAIAGIRRPGRKTFSRRARRLIAKNEYEKAGKNAIHVVRDRGKTLLGRILFTDFTRVPTPTHSTHILI